VEIIKLISFPVLFVLIISAMTGVAYSDEDDYYLVPERKMVIFGGPSY
jgi:hypothetical protein